MLKLDLRQQRHGVDVTAGGCFFGPLFGLLIIAGAVIGFGQIILGAAVTGLGLCQVRTANLLGKCL
ncbi:hypothetical protein D3C75_662960 [compost metagenome]